MMSPSEKQRLRDLASAVLDGTCDEAQRAELNEMLRRDAEARDEYLAYVDLHALMTTELSVGATTQELFGTTSQEAFSGADSTEIEAAKQTPLRSFFIATVIALAAGLLIAVTFLGTGTDAEEPPTFATVAQINQAVWPNEELVVGSRFGSETTMQLGAGFVRLEYDSGVEVTLEGPAELTFVDEAAIKLKDGLLTATVPPGAEGFTVNTPTAEVVDLGTAFGIDVRDDGFSNVMVFDGEVEIAVPDRDEKRLLTEGESVRIGKDHEIEIVGFDPKPFKRHWPIASAISKSTENVQFVPPWAKRMGLLQSDDRIFVAPEGHPVRLTSTLKLNISEPGEYADQTDLTPGELAAGKFVRSFSVHYAPQKETGVRRAPRVVGSITFEQPVLGLMVRHEELVESGRRFARRGASELSRKRELEFSDEARGDRVSLSEDRKTLTLDLIAPGRTSDFVRVITEAQPHRRGKRKPPQKK
ncbi:MAG: FecR domain-containing protein [Planctomycetota bacterium]